MSTFVTVVVVVLGLVALVLVGLFIAGMVGAARKHGSPSSAFARGYREGRDADTSQGD